MQTIHTPIFEKDGNQFVIPAPSTCGDSENEAWEIGIGFGLVEGVQYGCKFTGQSMAVEVGEDGKGNFPHRKASFGPFAVCIVAGPLFDEAAQNAPERAEA